MKNIPIRKADTNYERGSSAKMSHESLKRSDVVKGETR